MWRMHVTLREQTLQQERDGLAAEATARQAELDALDAALAGAEEQLARSPAKRRALELQARRARAALPGASRLLFEARESGAAHAQAHGPAAHIT